MRDLLREILEIPERAEECYEKNKRVKLPRRVPYLGMGSSYFAPLTLYYAGADIYPDIASEYYHRSRKKLPQGVLISQSGETSEVIWNLGCFKKTIAITDNPSSTLAKSSNTKKLIEIYAGEEEYFSSTKTFINTLITLYLGLDINPKQGTIALKKNFDAYLEKSKSFAQSISRYLSSHHTKGLYILGSGANIGSAHQGALVLSETTRFAWIGMPLSQYDHGPKETAENSVVIFLTGNKKEEKRIENIRHTLRKKSNALTLEIGAGSLQKELTPLVITSQLFLLMNFLADNLKIKPAFHLGSKITKVANTLK